MDTVPKAVVTMVARSNRGVCIGASPNVFCACYLHKLRSRGEPCCVGFDELREEEGEVREGAGEMQNFSVLVCLEFVGGGQGTLRKGVEVRRIVADKIYKRRDKLEF